MLETEKIKIIKNKNISPKLLWTRQKSQLCWVLEPILKEGKNFLKPDFIFFLRFKTEVSEEDQEKSGLLGENKLEVWLEIGEDPAAKQSLVEAIEAEGQQHLFPLGLDKHQGAIVSDMGFEFKRESKPPCKSLIFVPFGRASPLGGARGGERVSCEPLSSPGADSSARRMPRRFMT